MNFILGHVWFFFLTATSASGQKNDSLILGISKCDGIAVTTLIKKLMFVGLK